MHTDPFACPSRGWLTLLVLMTQLRWSLLPSHPWVGGSSGPLAPLCSVTSPSTLGGKKGCLVHNQGCTDALPGSEWLSICVRGELYLGSSPCGCTLGQFCVWPRQCVRWCLDLRQNSVCCVTLLHPCDSLSPRVALPASTHSRNTVDNQVGCASHEVPAKG